MSFLIQGADGRHYIQAVVDAYEANVPDVDERILAAAAVHDADKVEPILAAAISRPGGSKEGALAALANSLDVKVQALGDRIVCSYLEEHRSVVDFNVSRYVEDRLWHSHVISEDLNEVIWRVITAPAGSGRHVLAHPLTSPDGLSDPVLRTALLRDFIKATTDDESAVLTAQLLIKEVIAEYSTPDAFELLQQVLTRLKGTAADYVLFHAAYQDRETFAGSSRTGLRPRSYLRLVAIRYNLGHGSNRARRLRAL